MGFRLCTRRGWLFPDTHREYGISWWSFRRRSFCFDLVAVLQLELGKTLCGTVEAWQFLRTCINVSDGHADTVWTVSSVSAAGSHDDVTLAIYARRHVQPTHVRFDLYHVVHTADTSSSYSQRHRSSLVTVVHVTGDLLYTGRCVHGLDD